MSDGVSKGKQNQFFYKGFVPYDNKFVFCQVHKCNLSYSTFFCREPIDVEAKSSKSDSYVDIGVLKFAPQLRENKDIKAKPESGDMTHKFIISLTEAEKFEVYTFFLFRILIASSRHY